MSIKYKILFLISVLSIFLIRQNNYANDINVPSLLQEYKNYLETIHSFEMKITSVAEVHVPPIENVSSPPKMEMSSEILTRHSQNRAKIETKEVSNIYGGGLAETAINENGRFSAIENKSGHVISGERYKNVLIKNDIMEMIPCKIVFGYERFDENMIFLPDYLRNSTMKVATQSKDSQKDTILICDINDNHYEIWFTKLNHYYVPQKIIYQRPIEKTVIAKFSQVIYEVVEFQTVNKIPFPKRCFYSTEMPVSTVPLSGKMSDMNKPQNVSPDKIGKRTTKSDITFSKVAFNKNFRDRDFEIGHFIKIPNGTVVSMNDAPQIQYVWMDGKIVPKTDEVALAIARGDHKFIPGPQESRFWFIALGLFLMFLGGGLKLYSMLTDNNKSEKK